MFCDGFCSFVFAASRVAKKPPKVRKPCKSYVEPLSDRDTRQMIPHCKAKDNWQLNIYYYFFS